MMNTSPAERTARGRRTLLAVAAVFVLPMLAAWIWFYYVHALPPQGGANHGELISPAQRLIVDGMVTLTGEALSGAELERRWTLLHMVSGQCTQQCEQNLYHTRQARLALGRDVQRVRRMLVLRSSTATLAERLLAQHPDLLIGVGPSLLAQIEDAEAGLPPRTDAIYLVDPQLNLMMRFPAELDPRLMVKDLKKLLKISRIG